MLACEHKEKGTVVEKQLITEHFERVVFCKKYKVQSTSHNTRYFLYSVRVRAEPKLKHQSCYNRKKEIQNLQSAQLQLQMDIVWLKRDVRLKDHGPFAQVAKSNRPLVIIYNYEPDQLSEHSVHGSHVAFVNEGLVDLDKRLSLNLGTGTINTVAGTAVARQVPVDGAITNNMASSSNSSSSSSSEKSNVTTKYKFQVLTVCHAGIIFTLNSILQHTRQNGGIHRILTHEETGHLKSFARDKAVRRWCRTHSISIIEYSQTGVTRCLKSRDDFSKKFQAFVNSNLYETPTEEQLRCLRQRLVQGLVLHRQCESPLDPRQDEIVEIPLEHRGDRHDRQRGGESEGLAILESFLLHRGRHYSSGISSPNTSWTTGGRISPFVTWGNLSTRYIIHMLKQRQEELRQRKHEKILNPVDGPFLRSLSAFSSRMHWRSHFIQKLETEPQMEARDLCSAYQHLRRQPGDWNQDYYNAWSTGTTGFPFVDACMRCLITHGWLNFRMRAMLVSFATYNLWLDWKRIAPHLARVFLDYEPGIHYPQLQMQSGTTGINAMRVYNVTKQGKDQDPDGVFIKKYVPELASVPLEYIHEPSKMKRSVQVKCGVIIGNEDTDSNSCIDGQLKMPFQPKGATKRDTAEFKSYPSPIVDEQKSSTIAKEKVSSVRKQNSTKSQAQQVYIKHGSRSSKNGNMDGIKPKALSSTVKRVEVTDQGNIRSMLMKSNVTVGPIIANNEKNEPNSVKKLSLSSTSPAAIKRPIQEVQKQSSASIKTFLTHPSTDKKKSKTSSCSELKINYNDEIKKDTVIQWACATCTYLNDKPLAPTCFLCGTKR